MFTSLPNFQVKMAKRGAATELNQDNWAEEEEPEEFGTFRQASSDQLATRQIKKARRRGMVGEAPSGPSIFKTLGGFSAFGGSTNSSSQPSFSFLDSNSTSDSTKKPSFDFLSKTNSDSVKTVSDSNEKKNTQPFKLTQDSGLMVNKSVDTPKTNGVSSSSKTSSSKLFLANLKALNEGVLQWVKQHLDKNPHVNLAPVFDDYKKHFEELKKKYPPETESENDSDAGVVGNNAEKNRASEKENKPIFGQDNSTKSLSFGSSSASSTKDKAPEASKPAFNFGSAVSTSPEKSTESSKPLFSFGTTTTTTTEKTVESSKKLFSFSSTEKTSDTSKPLFSFGNSAASTKETNDEGEKKPAFSFGVFDSGKKSPLKSGGFSFAGATPAATSETPADAGKKDENEPTDEPPKVEVNEVKEDDALYEKKCKLFYMNDGSFVEKGVGTLFLKPAGEKTQLLVRAFTNLGNILLNIILNKSIPTIRAGKNGVIIACIPNPPLDGKSDSKEPVKMLIRVKTSDDADELLEKINDLKK